MENDILERGKINSIFRFNYSHHYALLGAHFLSMGFSVSIIKENFILYSIFPPFYISNQADENFGNF